VQFGFGFHGVVYTAFGGYFLRAKFGLAVPEAAQLRRQHRVVRAAAGGAALADAAP
jgi:hypothetical protein